MVRSISPPKLPGDYDDTSSSHPTTGSPGQRWRWSASRSPHWPSRIVTTVLAWAPPALTALCAPDADHYAWRITLSQEPDYLIQLELELRLRQQVDGELRQRRLARLRDRSIRCHAARSVAERHREDGGCGGQRRAVQAADPEPRPRRRRRPRRRPRRQRPPRRRRRPRPRPRPPRESELGGNPSPTPTPPAAPVLPDTSVSTLTSAAPSALALPIGLLILSAASVAYVVVRRR